MRTLRPVLACAICLAVIPILSAEKPFDFATTPGKLPKEVVPEEYAIHITPNLETLTFTGSETVKLAVRKPVRRLVLNALEVRVESASVNKKAVPKSAIKLDAKEETLVIVLEEELPAGTHTLALKFSGKVNQQGQGLYYAPYQEHGTGAKKVMLGSQFEATDARRLFPCWDEPSFRARFQLTVTVPANLTAVSNMPLERETKVTGGKELRFASTPSMSSYLNVLVVGELDIIEKESKGVLHRVVATRGKTAMGEYALQSSVQITEYFNDYFGEPYPLPKLDQIAVPGGFGGAMENWGGITYYESKLLFDPEKSSAQTKQDIYEVIAHEVAHQWFGNLVTMAWWDNLWLNEGFASWMGSKCTAHFNPQWEVWLSNDAPRDPTRRVGMPKETAMESDARSTTHPIQQKVATEAEANSAFDDITYKKGQSFIRMLESFLGEEDFRAGIRKYTAKHKFSNTTTADLWKALSEASGKPVEEIAACWTEQPGFPVVKVTRDENGKVSLTQERFTLNFPDAPALEWKIPLTYSIAGEAAPVSLLMTGTTAQLPEIPPGRALKLNAGGAGNYRVQYDGISWKLLLQELPKLSVADRVNLLADAWALVQAKRAPLSLYLELVHKLPPGTELAECEQVINAFDFIDRLMLGASEREQFQRYARSVLRPTFDKLGWEPRPQELPSVALLRVSLITVLGDLNDEDIIAGSRTRFQKFLSDPPSLPPDLRAAVFKVVGSHADETTWNKLHELGIRTTSIEEKQNYYDALAGTRDPKLITRALEISLSDELPTSRALHLVARVARQSNHPDLAWNFARNNMKALLGKADALGVNNYAAGLFTFFSDHSRISELKAYAKSSLPAEAGKAVEKAADEISFRAELKDRLIPQLATLMARTSIRP